MPFLGDDVSFYALLPEGSNGLEETINRMTLETLRDAMSRTLPVTVEVGIPKFRMEQSVDLRNVCSCTSVTYSNSKYFYISFLPLGFNKYGFN